MNATYRADSTGESRETTPRDDNSLTKQFQTHQPAYWRSVARIGAQIAGALEYAHSQSVLHRDIKPANLLLDSRGNAWVTDFGLAKIDGLQPLTPSSDVLGTVRYVAPESFDGNPTNRSDIYSLGLTIYELLATEPAYTEPAYTEPAYTEPDRARLLRQVIGGEFTPLSKRCPEVPRDLATIVNKAVEKDPNNRYATAGDLRDDLNRFLNDEPIQARQVSHLERLVRWGLRHQLLSTLIGVIAALLLFVTFASLVAAKHFYKLVQTQRKMADENKLLAKDAADAEVYAQRGFAKAKLTLSDMYRSSGIRSRRDGQPHLAALWFSEAARMGEVDPHRKWSNEVRAANLLATCPRPLFLIEAQEDSPIRRIEFHPSNNWVILKPWHSESMSKTQLYRLSDQKSVKLPKSIGLPTALSWNSSGDKLAVGDSSGQLRILSFPQLEIICSVSNRSPVGELKFSPDGKWIAASTNSEVRCWDSEALNLRASFFPLPLVMLGSQFKRPK